MNKKMMSGIISSIFIAAALFSFHTSYADESTTTDAISPDPVATTTDPVINFSLSSTTDPTATTTDIIASSTTPTDTASSTASSTEPIPVSIHLRIEAPDRTLYNNDITVNPCQATSTEATSTSAYCALIQTGLPLTWTWYSFGSMLSGIDTYNGSDGNYWAWFQDLNLGMTSLDMHPLTSGEHLLLTYGVNPLKISLSTTTIDTESTTTITVTGFGYDTNWNAIWSPVSSSTLLVGGFTTDIASSTFDWGTTTDGTYSIQATKQGYVPSDPVVVTVSQIGTSTSSTTDQTNNTGTNSGGTNNQTSPTFDIDRAVQYLVNQQQPDGSFGSSLYTDWSAIALASYSDQSQAKQKLIAYLNSTLDMSSIVTDSERHAMALMALGINPYSGTSVNYIQKITDSFDGNQIGDANLYNDDIFALFPLLKAGYSASDPIIVRVVQFILSKQNSNGAWLDPDLTAAAIQALSQVQSLDGVPDAIARAKDYLKTVESGGGFGTSYSTSWALQAISALGETPSQWSQNSISPLDYLTNLQQSDGGIGTINDTIQNRIWATAYAIPAVQGKTWPMLLSSFARPQSFNPPSSDSGLLIISTSTAPLATTAPSVNPPATTTLVIASTTPHIRSALSFKPAAKHLTGAPTASTSTSTASSSDEATSTKLLAAAGASGSTKLPFTVGVLTIAALSIGIGMYRFRA